MSNAKPILILQMQRMGDLVLSFPLAGWLSGLYQQNPIWVVGEPFFFKGLLDISPPVTYFAYSDAAALHGREYQMVINLSHRPEAARLAGALKTEKLIGPYINDKGDLHILGDWQLYRSSINHNNRHNLFHWADLNAMDVIPRSSMQRSAWPPLKKTGSTGRVGLFVGASEKDKRPDASFWAYLAAKFIRMGAKPVLLGGDADKTLAAEAAGILGAPAINLSGKFNISQLCNFIGNLDLLIVPDTGPMHIASWLGVPTLNISMGPVNAWETAQFSPGQYVLRSTLSCVGCWECTQKSVLCKERMLAEKVSVIARLLLEKKPDRLAELDIAGNELFITRRDEYGLFHLEPVNGEYSPRYHRSLFWKHFFGLHLGFFPEEAWASLPEKAQALMRSSLAPASVKAGRALLERLSSADSANASFLGKDDFWLSYPPLLRPLSSYIQMLLQNENFSSSSLFKAQRMAESFLHCVSRR